MTEIEVFIEGGGNNVTLQSELRQGFDALFRMEKSRASQSRIGLKFICCGSRRETYEAFMDSTKRASKKISALLVDSETAMVPAASDKSQDAIARVAHLRLKTSGDGRGQGDGWELPENLVGRVHLMVQCMETWIVADTDALQKFYRQEFKKEKLPKRLNLEDESKIDILTKLEAATKDTQKGRYAKIKHASKLLTTIDPETVGKRCPRFMIFREWLAACIDG